MLRLHRVLVLAAVAVCGQGLLGVAGAAGAQAASSVRTPGVWGRAAFVPGLGVLNTGGAAAVQSVSCTSADNCAAGGYFTVRPGRPQGFVVAERNGVWGRAIEVPGLRALVKGGQAQVLTLSCTSAGNCAASGNYQASGQGLSFVASEKNGVWGTAGDVPGLQLIVTGRYAEADTLSCASPGNCAVGGLYENVVPGNVFRRGYVVSQRNGRWNRALGMPGSSVLSKQGDSIALSVSCGAVGHCTAAGDYTDRHGHLQGFVTKSSARTGRAA